MIARHASETWLAWITLIGTSLHFILETWYHFTWGQPLQALLVDYICNGLMVFGGLMSLRLKKQGRSAAGLLAAGWAFALGFGWRSVFGQLELLQSGEGSVNGEAGFVLPVIFAALASVVVMLLWALYLAYRQAFLGQKSFIAIPY